MYINDIPNDTDDMMDKANDLSNNNNEVNQINNFKLKEKICDTVVAILLNLKIIKNIEEIGGTQIQFGYLFTKENGELETLLKAIYEEKTYYLAIHHGETILLNTDEQLFNYIVKETIAYHKCLKNSEMSIMTLNKQTKSITK